jgi:hypothetical protein
MFFPSREQGKRSRHGRDGRCAVLGTRGREAGISCWARTTCGMLLGLWKEEAFGDPGDDCWMCTSGGGDWYRNYWLGESVRTYSENGRTSRETDGT